MRLITRADLDGLTCAILLQEVENIEAVDFAHPKDVQDGKVAVTKNDILANLPHDARVGLWFDHHVSQADKSSGGDVDGAFAVKPSAARVIVDHYKSAKFDRYKELMEATDRLDSAQLNMDDVVAPKGWILVGYTLDPRTGLGAFKDYFLHLMQLAKTKTIDQIVADPQVKDRIERVKTEEAQFKEHVKADSRQDGNVVITDVRGKKNLPTGNRFLIYTLFPTANVSVRIADGRAGEFVSLQVGHSIFNRTCKTNVGELMAKHGGGGHVGAGTCQPKPADADRVLGEVVDTLKKNG
ncbi:MAG TPA: exopolyphosphatase [Candidatus Binatia bacterium]|nr:exopolyphosphatase [Candidatus Binatia bacterium]